MKREPTVKCAVVGAGWWGVEAHIPAVQNHPCGELVAVQKREIDAVNRLAKDFEIPFPCSTVEEVLAVDGIEAVIVSSTPNMHHKHAAAALTAGCHVLIEKPMTITVTEAEELVNLAERRKLQLLVSCPWHYTEHNIEARRLVQSGALGRIKMISVLMTNFSEGLYRGLSWHEAMKGKRAGESAIEPYIKPRPTSYSDPEVAGGGQIYCQVSHAAAHVAFITGCEPVEVFARFDNDGTSVDVYDTLSIKLDDGALVSMASTGATMRSKRTYEVRIYGTEGMLFLELWKGTMEFHDRDGEISRYPNLTDVKIYPSHAPAQNLIDTITGKSENGSPATLGLSAMRMIDGACRSAESGRNIVV